MFWHQLNNIGCLSHQFIAKWLNQQIASGLLFTDLQTDTMEAAVVIQRRTTLIGPVLFIMTFISYSTSQEMHLSGSGEPGIYTQNKTVI
jgi:hypothetical protein